MKKRVLSVALALALCLTVLPGISLAAGGQVGNMLDKVGNILDNVATQEQQEALAAVAETVVAQPASYSDEAWKTFVDALVKDSVFDDNNVSAYFVLRYLQANTDLYDEGGAIDTAVKALEQADIDVDTSEMGIRESIDSFDLFADKLTEAFEGLGEEGLAEVAAIEPALIDTDALAEGTVKVTDIIKDFAKEKALEPIDLVKNIVFATSTEELNAAYDAFMKDDMAKKTGAIIAGQPLLKELASGLKQGLTNFVKDNSADLLSAFNASRVDIASADKAEAAKGAQALAADIAAAMDASTEEKIAAVKAELANRGLSFAEIDAAASDLADVLDPEGSFRVIWIDLIANRLMQVSPNTEVQPGQPVYLQFNNWRFANYGIDPITISDSFYAVTDSDQVTAELTDNWYTLDFNEYTAPESVELTVYRNAEAGEGDVYRYVGKYTVSLSHKEKGITLDELKTVYTPGEEILIKGTSDGFEDIIISVIEPGNTTPRYYATVSADKYAAEGVTISFTDEGSYTVIVGDNEKSVTAQFEVKAEESQEKNITVETPENNSVYAPGQEVIFKGTSTGFEQIIIAIVEPGSTDPVSYATISPEQYAAGYPLSFNKVGSYTAIIGDSEVNKSVSFTVSMDSYEKYIALDDDALQAQYVRGETITIKGTSKGFDQIVIAIRKAADAGAGIDNPTGAVYYTTVNPSEFEAGIEVVIPDDFDLCKYIILVGETGESTETVVHNDTAEFEVVESGKLLVTEKYSPTKISISKTTKYSSIESRLPKTVTLTAQDGETMQASVAWDETDSGFVYGNINYYIKGFYEIPAGYAAGEEVDGVVEVYLYKSSGGGGGTSKSIDLDEDAVEKSVIRGQAVTIKGTSKGYDEIVINITAPDGTKSTVTITPEQFEEGYDLVLDQIGEYTISVGSETVKVTVTGVTKDIFEMDEHNNYLIGYEDGTIRPEANVTREEITTILFRLLKDKSRVAWLTNSTDKFDDVEADRWSMTSIATLDTIGILNGYEDGSFRPGNAITRAEFAALCSRLAATEPAAADVEYKDIQGHWAANEIRVVSLEGWFQGDENGNFRPDDKITRAEAVTVINRILERNDVDAESIKNVEIAEFSDLDADAWYYIDMVEAANAHKYDKDEAGKETWKEADEEKDWTTFEE